MKDVSTTRLIIYQATIYKTKVANSNTAFTFVNHSDLLNDKNDFTMQFMSISLEKRKFLQNLL